MNRGSKKAQAETPSAQTMEAETRLAAQRIFEERRAKGLEGDEVSDWLEAEAEVKKRHKLG